MNTQQSRKLQTYQKHQRGIVAVVVTIGMIALLAVTGLALDTGHMLLNKTRIQNAADAAALAAANTLQANDGDMSLARSAAENAFSNNLSGELENAEATITVTYSETLQPGSFANTVTDPEFVKVTSSVVPLQSFLVQVVGMNSKSVDAVAVAGFANGAQVCDLIPITICAMDPSATEYPFGFTEFNGSNASESEVALKFGAGQPDTELGTGNFHLLNFDYQKIREGLAGGDQCSFIGEDMPINLAPGAKVGITVQGINTRFGIYKGQMKGTEDLYPPDLVNSGEVVHNCTDSSDDNYACSDPGEYLSYYDSIDKNDANRPFFKRRIVSVPISDCSEPASGTNESPSMLTTRNFGCFLLKEPSSQSQGSGNNGSEETSGSFNGFFLPEGECSPPSVGVTESSGVEIVVLYKNPDGDGS